MTETTYNPGDKLFAPWNGKTYVVLEECSVSLKNPSELSKMKPVPIWFVCPNEDVLAGHAPDKYELFPRSSMDKCELAAKAK